VETSGSPAFTEAVLMSVSNGTGLAVVGVGMLVRSIRTILVCISLNLSVYGFAGGLVELIAAPNGLAAGKFVGMFFILACAF